MQLKRQLSLENLRRARRNIQLMSSSAPRQDMPELVVEGCRGLASTSHAARDALAGLADETIRASSQPQGCRKQVLRGDVSVYGGAGRP